MEKKITRKKAIKIGAGIAAGAMGLKVVSCAVSKEESEILSTLDPDIYHDSARDAVAASAVIEKTASGKRRLPNIICIVADDMGYGDLSCYGSKAINTPNLDRLARDGVRFTEFYSSNALCSPSRAGLLTGRYPQRTGVTFPLYPESTESVKRWLVRQVGQKIFGKLGLGDVIRGGGQSVVKGLPASEITIAEALKLSGYATAAVGKWHLGDFTVNPEYHPRKHGFDYFYGMQGSNDDWPVPVYQNEKEVIKDMGLNQGPYTEKFTNEAIGFIKKSQDKPFFLYLAHKDPHQPCIPSEKFKNSSEGGGHGDVVQEVDFHVGRIVKTLKERGLDKNTLIFFTSDNGPWFNGSAGTLRGRKGQSYEGGFRVPMIASWPGKIPKGRTCDAASMNIDFLPTILSLGGLSLPKDRTIDGKNIWKLMTGQEKKSPHDALYLFHHNEIEGVREGNWKYFRNINHFVYPVPIDKKATVVGGLASGSYTYNPEGKEGKAKKINVWGDWPLLYNMKIDPGEEYNVIKKYPDIGKRKRKKMKNWELKFFSNPRGWLKT